MRRSAGYGPPGGCIDLGAGKTAAARQAVLISEPIEMAVRSAMHQAGAAALAELLQFDAPAADQRTIACSRGHRARYRELGSKPLLTAVGKVEVSRPYYLCPHCHAGQC